jgi:hypothetical protein
MPKQGGCHLSRLVKASAIALTIAVAIALTAASLGLAGCSRKAKQPGNGGSPSAGDPATTAPGAGTPVGDKITTYADGRLTAGPFPFAQNGFYFIWTGPNGLAVDIAGKLEGLVDVAGKRYLSASSLEGTYAAGPDGAKVAFSRGGRLVVKDLKSGDERTWSLSKSGKDHPELANDVLLWSPNGRFLVGALTFYDSADALGKLWVLDLETGKMTVISGFEANHWFNQPTWSEDGNQVVLRHYLEGYTESSYSQWVLLDLAKAESKVVVPPDSAMVDYAFTWGSSGGVQATPVNVGPGGVRAIGYDPTSRRFEYDLYEGGPDVPFVATELCFVDHDGQAKARVELQPALAQAGLPSGELSALNFQTTWSADGEYVLLQGLARDTKDNIYGLNGIVRYAEKSVRFAPIKPQKSVPQPMLSPEYVWNGPLALIITDDNRTLQVLDARTMKATQVAEGQDIIFYEWSNGKAVYVTPNEVSAVTPGDGNKKVLLSAGSGEVFILSTIPSPDGRYLALTNDHPADSTFKIEVLDLSAVR